jgi:hypothetical protein
MGKTMDENFKKAEAAEKAIADTLGMSGIELQEILASGASFEEIVSGKNLTEEQISMLETYIDDLYSSVDAMKEQRDMISENLITAFDDMNKEMDESTDKLNHMTSMIDGFRNIIDLAGKEALGISDDLIKQMNETSKAVADNNIRVSKAQLQ